MKGTVTVRLIGRYANQCFEVAACICYALKHGLDWYIPTFGINEGRKTRYQFPNQKNITTNRIWRQINHHYEPIPEFKSVQLRGHYQSSKYWYGYESKLRQILGFPEATIDKCAIHIRRTDYLKQPLRHPVLSLEYYYGAIDIMKEWCNEFVIFTDDPEYAKAHFDYEVISGDPEKDIRHMAEYKYQIIANSTFSLFPALINHKTVISPDTKDWYGRQLNNLELKDLLPDHFIKVKQMQAA